MDQKQLMELARKQADRLVNSAKNQQQDFINSQSKETYPDAIKLLTGIEQTAVAIAGKIAEYNSPKE